MTRHGETWTDADITILRRLTAQGVHERDIAIILGRASRGAIGMKRKHLGIEREHVGVPVGEICRLRDEGLTIPQIADATGLSWPAVNYRIRFAGALSPNSRLVPARVWSAEQDAQLQDLRIAGLNHSEIARRTGRTVSAVRTRLFALAYHGALTERRAAA